MIKSVIPHTTTRLALAVFGTLLSLFTCFAILGCRNEPQTQPVSDPTENDFFKRYAIDVKTTSSSPPADVDLTSDPDGELFADWLTQGAKHGPNFAGRYTIVSWACGTGCQTNALISADSGAILGWFYSCAGYRARLDSRLIIVNPQEDAIEAPGECYSEFYELKDQRLIEISDAYY